MDSCYFLPRLALDITASAPFFHPPLLDGKRGIAFLLDFAVALKGSLLVGCVEILADETALECPHGDHATPAMPLRMLMRFTRFFAGGREIPSSFISRPTVLRCTPASTAVLLSCQ